MNYRKTIGILGGILMAVGVCMLLPLLWSLYYGEPEWHAFLLSSLLTVFVGWVAFNSNSFEGNIGTKEAFAVVVFGWLSAALFGALPYLLSGAITSFVDAFFETMSGFTTTGASVFPDLEILARGVIFWRCLTHWLGGMGIIVLFVALLSTLGGVGAMQMFSAEMPGYMNEKLKPRISETAKILWYTYLLMTLAETLLLFALGMPLFDALCHAFGTLATGGSGTKNASVGAYSDPLIQLVITLFMFLAGVNFSLHYQAFRGRNIKTFWRNAEFRLYLGIILSATALISMDLLLKGALPLGTTIRQAGFQVVSMITTTGFTITDFEEWSFFAKAILVLLMFTGACAGSTSGAMKIERMMILLKQFGVELKQAIHPRAILSPKVDGKSIPKGIISNTQTFFFVYITVAALSTIIMAALGLDLVSALTAVAATLGNVGPGLAKVGPLQNYHFISAPGKYYLTFLMLLGRLELYTVLVLFMPSFWRK